MKAILIAPPWLDIYARFKEAAKLGCVSPPLGLMYLAGAVQSDGHECILLDMESQQLTMVDVLEIIRKETPELIGLTATTPVYANAAAIAMEIRKAFPASFIGIGGVHATVVGKKVIEECPAWDFQVSGEGEMAIRDILRVRKSQVEMSDIQGIHYRDASGKIHTTEPRPLISDLDLIPMPNRTLLSPDLFRHHLPGRGEVKYAGIFTSRGCPFQCTFCSQHTMYGRKVRWHSIPRVMSELHHIVEELGVNHIIIMDETLTLNRARLLELCRCIQQDQLNFTWEGWTHASTIDEELLIAMKQAGAIRLSFGIESGNPEILKKIKKGVTLDQIRNAYKMAKKVGIETRGSAILGHPGETRQTALDTIRFIRSIKECQQVFLNIACPYPGTELYDAAIHERDGMKLLTEDYSKYTRYGDPVIQVNDLTPKKLKKLQMLGLLWFYCTPARIWYNMVKRAGIRSGCINAMAFIRGIARSLFAKVRAGE